MTEELQKRRLAIVREHMQTENVHDFDATLATFDHPRYEIVPTGDVYDGPEEVAEYYRTSRAAFPDQRNENTTLWAADNAVVAEFDLVGTHEGELRGISPTGRSFRCRMCAIFEFPEGERPDRVRARVLRPGDDCTAAARGGGATLRDDVPHYGL